MSLRRASACGATAPPQAASALVPDLAHRPQPLPLLGGDIDGGGGQRGVAEVLLRDLGGGRFNAFSAGSRPAAAVNPFTIEMLRNRGKGIGMGKQEEKKSTQSFDTCNQSLIPPVQPAEKYKFDVDGERVQEFAGGQWTGHELQGRNLPELLQLCRSAVPSQQAAAFKILEKVTEKEWEESFHISRRRQ